MADTSPILSVVIPVYNSADYIPSTLSNLFADQFKSLDRADWELILVDDGSTDGSAGLIESLIAGNPYARLIRKPNGGAASARNAGLAAANGDYVYFYDSDDLMLGGTLPAVCSVARNAEPDLIKFCLKHISHDEYMAMRADVPAADISEEDFTAMTPAEYLDITQGMTEPSGDCTVLTIYRRKLLQDNSLAFDTSMYIGEDTDLTWRAMLKASSVSYTPKRLHLYHLHPQSISHNRNLSRINDGMLTYLLHILDIRRRYAASSACSQGGVTGLNNTARYVTNAILAKQILIGEPFVKVYRTMKTIKRNGGDIHPGRPRFSNEERETATARDARRRWFAAYIVASIVWIQKWLDRK